MHLQLIYNAYEIRFKSVFLSTIAQKIPKPWHFHHATFVPIEFPALLLLQKKKNKNKNIKTEMEKKQL